MNVTVITTNDILDRTVENTLNCNNENMQQQQQQEKEHDRARELLISMKERRESIARKFGTKQASKKRTSSTTTTTAPSKDETQLQQEQQQVSSVSPSIVVSSIKDIDKTTKGSTSKIQQLKSSLDEQRQCQYEKRKDDTSNTKKNKKGVKVVKPSMISTPSNTIGTSVSIDGSMNSSSSSSQNDETTGTVTTAPSTTMESNKSNHSNNTMTSNQSNTSNSVTGNKGNQNYNVSSLSPLTTSNDTAGSVRKYVVVEIEDDHHMNKSIHIPKFTTDLSYTKTLQQPHQPTVVVRQNNTSTSTSLSSPSQSSSSPNSYFINSSPISATGSNISSIADNHNDDDDDDDDDEEERNDVVYDNNNNDDDTNSSIKPPTLEEIYAAMGESLLPIAPSLNDDYNNKDEVKDHITLQQQQHQQPQDKKENLKSISKKNKSKRIVSSNASVPNRDESSTSTNTTNIIKSSSTFPSVSSNRSIYISQLYNDTATSPTTSSTTGSTSISPCKSRPTTNLQRFQQRIHHEQQQQQQIQKRNRTIPLLDLNLDDDNNDLQHNNVNEKINDEEAIVNIALLSETKEKENSSQNKQSEMMVRYEETSLSDDVLDVLSSPLCTDTTSSATISFSEFIFDSDNENDNACDYTTNSDTSGWASMGDSTYGPMSGTCDISITDHTNHDDTVENTTMIMEKPALPEVEVSPINQVTTTTNTSSTNRNIMKKSTNGSSKKRNNVTFQKDTSLRNKIKPLFVSGRKADELCFANGGHYSLAKSCGMDLLSETKVKLIPLPIKPSTPTFVRLSTDFRCGTYGSLYDIANRSSQDMMNRSGLNHRKKASPPDRAEMQKKSKNDNQKRTGERRNRVPRTEHQQQQSQLVAKKSTMKKRSSSKESVSTSNTTNSYVPVRGGIYDTVLHSSSLKAGVSYNFSEENPTVNDKKHQTTCMIIPEHISDQQCGVQSCTVSMLQGYSQIYIPH